jgi:hypothetical protein
MLRASGNGRGLAGFRATLDGRVSRWCAHQLLKQLRYLGPKSAGRAGNACLLPDLSTAGAGSAGRSLAQTARARCLFLLSWIVIFFAGVLAVFFAGSARYLLPISAPLALLASRLPRKWLAIGFGAQMTLGLALATANYQHWDGYRRVAYNLRDLSSKRRVWVDDEWGLRHYLQI